MLRIRFGRDDLARVGFMISPMAETGVERGRAAPRRWGVWALLLAPPSRRRGLDHVAVTLVRSIPLARSVTSAQLLLVGLAAVLAGHPW